MTYKKKRVKLTFSQIVIYIILGFSALTCVLPEINMVAVSFSEASAVNAGKVYLWPVKFTLGAYKHLISEGTFFNSFMISVYRVLTHVPLSMFLIIIMAYPLSKSDRQFRYQKYFMWFCVIPMLFGGGLIPYFLVVRSLGMLNKFSSLVIPGALNIWNMIMMMNFFKGIPKEMDESAYIDGADPWTVLWQIYVPMSKPSIATITLFSIVGTWNDFFTGLIFMNRVEKYPLQTYLNSLNLKLQFVSTSGQTDIETLIERMKLTGMNFNAAKIILSLIPILVVYPFLQRYFIKGIVIGAVKE